jgi:hypothetical protein
MAIHFQSFYFKRLLHYEIWNDITLLLKPEVTSFTVKYETICIQVKAGITSVSNNNYFLIPECLDHFIFQMQNTTDAELGIGFETELG